MNHIGAILNDHQSNITPQPIPVTPIVPTPAIEPMIVEPAPVVEEPIKPVVTPTINKPELDPEEIKRQVYSIKNQLDALIKMLDGDKPVKVKATVSPAPEVITGGGEKIIEGVFNGEMMIGADGQEYTVPPNYASKSKLVEGDMMKLTVTPTGSFIYKQIGPAVRKRLIGKLIFNQEIQTWDVEVENIKYKVLTASITFYKGKPSDEVVLLVPENGKSDWGAVENIISK